jgi:hypothetical protein
MPRRGSHKLDLNGDNVQGVDCFGGGNQQWQFQNCNINGCELVNGNGSASTRCQQHHVQRGQSPTLGLLGSE